MIGKANKLSINSSTTHSNGKSVDKKTASAQTRGQFERDPKNRKGHFTGAGDAPLTKK
jgi:hypothetical protein